MRGWLRLGIVLLAAVLALQWWESRSPDVATPAPAATGEATAPGETDARWPAFLPPEAVATLEAIERGGPFPYERDGVRFGNREKLLPAKPRSYYREYTVRTPGVTHRGARRIVCGGPAKAPEVCYYTHDHYQSFARIRE